MSEKKKHEPEYTLHVFHTKDPETNVAATAVAVLSVREFVSFRYEIPLESSLDGRTMSVIIHGLRVPENLVPGKGHAQGIIKYPTLQGEYELIITNVDGEVNRFSLSISSRTIGVKKLSKKSFIVYSSETIKR